MSFLASVRLSGWPLFLSAWDPSCSLASPPFPHAPPNPIQHWSAVFLRERLRPSLRLLFFFCCSSRALRTVRYFAALSRLRYHSIHTQYFNGKFLNHVRVEASPNATRSRGECRPYACQQDYNIVAELAPAIAPETLRIRPSVHVSVNVEMHAARYDGILKLKDAIQKARDRGVSATKRSWQARAKGRAKKRDRWAIERRLGILHLAAVLTWLVERQSTLAC